MTLAVAVCVRAISFGDGVGGLERAAATHVIGLLDEGIETRLFAPAAGVSGVVPSAVELVDVPWPDWNAGTGRPTFGLAYQTWVRRLWTAVSGRQWATRPVLHLHGGAAGIAHLAALSTPAYPTVINPHGMEEFATIGSRLRSAPNRLLIRHLMRNARCASAIIATDTSLLAPTQTNLRVAPDAIVLIPNSIDMGYLRSLASGATRAEQFTIVTVGRLVRNKGYDLLADALGHDLVREVLPAGSRWVHFGDGPEHEALKARCGQLPHIDLRIRVNESDREVQSGLASADLFVQPSRHEGSSLTTLEAMCHGRTIVATPVGGIPDKIVDGRTGYLSDAVDASSIARALVRALVSTEETGEAAQQLVKARFSTDVSRRDYRILYENLCRDAPAPGGAERPTPILHRRLGET